MEPNLDGLLQRWREGDRAAGDEVIAFVYSDLRLMARRYLRRERPGHTLQSVDLVNEAYLRLGAGSAAPWQNRTHFIAVAARQMRRILIDYARRRKALKRGDTKVSFSLSGVVGQQPQIESILVLEALFQELEAHDARAAEVVELRVFGGLLEKEIATVLDVSVATVKRDWTFGKAWLVRRLQKGALADEAASKRLN